MSHPQRRCERGSAVVDFVLVLVLLVPLFLGILQVALVLHVRNTLVSAASEGARSGATADGSLADAEAKTRDQINGAISATIRRKRVGHGMTSIGGVPAVVVRVEATVPALGIGGPGIHLSVEGHAIEEQP